MSTVYRGEDTVLGRAVAIKVLRLTSESDPLDLTARFLSEAKITALLHHPSIVTLFDFGTTAENKTYIVMEYVEGRSLRHHLGKLTNQQFGEILMGAAMGLDYAHSHGVVHRDVKPSNLLVTLTGRPKILDFGIALMSGGDSSRITQTGIVVGTPDYLSPEQISGGVITPAADQFALAAVTFELLTGRRPFTGATMTETMAAVITQPPLSALGQNGTLGKACDEVLRKALSKRPQDRFPTCSDFADALLGALGTSSGWRPYSGSAPSENLPEAPTAASPRTVAAAARLAETQTRIDMQATVGISTIGSSGETAGYSFTQAIGSAGPFFGSGEAHFREIKSKLSFYQEQLQGEYDALIRQMRTTYILWLIAVSLAFCVLLAGVVLFLLHQTTGGSVTTASSAMLYFLQRVFHEREDAYRKAAEAKRNTVEYGNQWSLVIQTIQGMEDPGQRVLREGQLVETLTDHLRGRGKAVAARKAKKSP